MWHLQERPPSPRRPRVLGIGGYPYMGKSRLAHRIQAAWPHGRAATLATESVILPRAARLEREIDGCSPAGHDMHRLLEHVTALCAGRSTLCREYSWSSGDAPRMTIVTGLRQGDLLIIDGSVAAAPPIANLCDLLIVLSPLEEERWLPLACERDTVERGWDAGEARAQNVRKAKTSASLGISPGTPLFLSIGVDPVSWAWSLPDQSTGPGCCPVASSAMSSVTCLCNCW